MKIWEIERTEGLIYRDSCNAEWLIDNRGNLLSWEYGHINLRYNVVKLLELEFTKIPKMEFELCDGIDWTTVAVDTPIYVRENPSDEWQKRHFASFRDKKIYAYLHGLTSWTADPQHAVDYKYAKLP